MAEQELEILAYAFLCLLTTLALMSGDSKLWVKVTRTVLVMVICIILALVTWG